MTTELDKLLRQEVVKTLDGEKLYKFRILKRKQASEVYHNAVKAVVKVFAGAVGAESAEAKIAAVDSLDFETIWYLAGVLLKGCIITPDMNNLQLMITINDINDTDYFDENHEELYIALYYALKANYPKSYSRLMGKLKGSVPGIQAAMLQKFGIASEQNSPQPSQSPNGGDSAPAK